MIGHRKWGQGAAGRRPGFGLTAVELLEKAEQYERSTREPTQEGFLRKAKIRTTRTEDGHTLSLRQLRTWRSGYSLPYPIVPTHDAQRQPILVYLVDDDANSTLLWISANVQEVLGYEPSELIDRPAAEALCPGHDPRRDYPELAAEFVALREGTLESSTPRPAHFVHRHGSSLTVEIRGAYGKRNRAWYCQATVLQTADLDALARSELEYAETLDTFNVQPYLITPPIKHSLRGFSIGRTTHFGLRHTPSDLLKRYMPVTIDVTEAVLRELDGEEP